MPGRDITRLLNSAVRVLLLLTCVIGCGTSLSAPAWSQEPAASTQSKPDASQQAPDKTSPAPAEQSKTEETKTAQDSTDQPKSDQSKSDQPKTDQPKTDQQTPEQQKKPSDEGIYVFHKEADEVLLHATVVDDKQHIITNLDRNAFSVFEDGKPQN